MIFSQLLLRSEAPVGLTLLIFLLNALTLFLAGGWAAGHQTAGFGDGVAIQWRSASGCWGSAEAAAVVNEPTTLLPSHGCPAGLWASVQFRFVQLQYPGVVIAFERMLIAGCLPVAAAVQTWGMVAGVGMSAAAFFLAALLCGLYYLFARPLPSSFHLGTRQKTAVGAWGAGRQGSVA